MGFMAERSDHMVAMTQHGIVGYFNVKVLGEEELVKKAALIQKTSRKVFQLGAREAIRPVGDESELANEFHAFSDEQMARLRAQTELDQLAPEGVLTQAQMLLDAENRAAKEAARAEKEALAADGVLEFKPGSGQVGG